jgi:hypothetical protein
MFLPLPTVAAPPFLQTERKLLKTSQISGEGAVWLELITQKLKRGSSQKLWMIKLNVVQEKRRIRFGLGTDVRLLASSSPYGNSTKSGLSHDCYCGLHLRPVALHRSALTPPKEKESNRHSHFRPTW